jgi:glycosyltransferase involved in cell wall biosynthesis
MARFISVVVATRDRGHIVGPTLEALTKLQYEDFEIIVVDQSADNRTERIAETMHATGCGVRYVRTAASGVSDGRNVGALLSSAEIVAYTDDDCIVDPQWLTCIDAELADATVSAVYGRLLPYEWQGRTGCEVALKNAPERAVYVGRTPPWHIGHGGNMAFRRSALLSIGGFDPLLGAGGLLCSGEDGDVAYRLLAAGHQVVYSPAALAFHRHWKDWSSQVAMERAYGIGAGAQFAKYLR